MTDWYQLKLFVSHATTLSMDALHLLGGFLALLLMARLFHRPLSDVRPWLAVLLLELLNEWRDLFVERWPDVGQQYGESARDIVLTMLVPTLLLLVARHWPQSLVPTAQSEPVDEAD